MMKKGTLHWHLSHADSDFRRAKQAASERFIGVSKSGPIRAVKVATEILHNLVGIGVAEKRTERRPCGTAAITFYVERKLPKSRLTQRLMLPRRIAGLTCDVVACGRMRPAAGGPPFTPLDPLTPGAQIQVDGADPGTAGAFVRDADGDTCLISNCHVLSSDLASGIGKPVYQPGRNFAGSRQVGTVKAVKPIMADGRNTVDVAIAKLDPNINYDSQIPQFGQIRATGQPSHTEPVAKFGQATLGTSGQLESIDTDVVVHYKFMSAAFATVYVFTPDTFADDGDSGSIVLEPRTGTAVGLIFATTQLRNFAIPIEAIDGACPGLTWL